MKSYTSFEAEVLLQTTMKHGGTLIPSSCHIGTYKPDDNNFNYMIDRLAESGIAKSKILHTAQSLFHDHEPANRHGLKSCWIDRQHIQDGSGATPPPGEMPHYDFRFCSMAELAEAHRKQLTQ